ncbi:HlyD family efflux transporter periplasmic adaptor subunit [Scytonema sp. UIC 10036]|uniref:HlyD family secretion protein n=1 Tax=Scytonema sp. UIC 10036 TaxID=2304196 RepID=UPI0012DA8A34|nr:HlyD family efflux transporter periplasmic adaptor subunit [Scytonema sp. UIC 10036]MUG91239.1 HlyD family efflux transporter periplasmic adaptor subunit [Scytonema sp. UIC 10036]
MLSTPDPDQLNLVQGDEFLPLISPWTTIGTMFLVSIFSGAVALGGVLKYNATVKVPATIRPTGELRIAQATTEGIVTSIKVKANQVVRKGEQIASIDNSQLQTRKKQLQGNIQHNRLQFAQIDAQFNALDNQIAAEKILMNRSIAAAEADLVLHQEDYQDKQITTSAQVQAVEASLALAKEEMKRYQQLANTGAIAELQVKEKEQAFKASEAKLKEAQASLNPSNASVTIATERIAQERARGLATLAALHKERENLLQRQIEIQNSLGRDVKELQQIEIELSKTFILAPINGTILKLELRNASQVVQPGEAIAYIAPMNAPLQIKANVEAKDIDKVKPGQKVQMQVSACPYPDYGTLKGTVTTVAPDALPAAGNETEARASRASYEVIIQPETRFVGNEDHQCLLQPGMEGTADIISRSETVLKFILRKARLLTDL